MLHIQIPVSFISQTAKWVLWMIHDCTKLYVNLKYLLLCSWSAGLNPTCLVEVTWFFFFPKKSGLVNGTGIIPLILILAIMSCIKGWSVCWMQSFQLGLCQGKWDTLVLEGGFWPSVLTAYGGQWPRNVQNTTESSNAYSEFQAEHNQQKLIEKVESIDHKISVTNSREDRSPLRCPARFCWVDVPLSLHKLSSLCSSQ